MSSKNLFVSTVVVLLVAGGALGAFWAYSLAGSTIVAPTALMATTTVTVGTTDTPRSTATAVTTAASATGVPKVNVDLIGLSTGPVIGNEATVAVFLVLTNPSESSLTVTSIKYQVWVNEQLVGSGGTDEFVSLSPMSEVDVRTEMPIDVSELREDVVEALTIEGAAGTLRIKGDLEIKNGFGTATVPFEGEGAIGLPVDT